MITILNDNNLGHEGLGIHNGGMRDWGLLCLHGQQKKEEEKHGFRCFWSFYEVYETWDPSRTNQGEK